MPRLEVEFKTTDPQLADTLRLLAGMPEYTVARAECEAQLYLTLLRQSWRDADQYRRRDADRAGRAARAAAKAPTDDGSTR